MDEPSKDIEGLCGTCDGFEAVKEPESVKEYKKLIGNKSHMLARDKIFDIIAKKAVWEAMLECERKGVKKCSFCSYTDTGCIGHDNSCIENGYMASESINSAKDKIKVALSGRT